MRRFAVFGIVLVIGLIVSIFTVSREDVRKFNDKLVDIANTMDTQHQSIITDIERYQSGQTIDVARMRSNIDKMDRALKVHLDKLTATKIPDDDVCREFHKTVEAYVTQRKNCPAVYRKMCDYIQDHNPGGEDDVKAVVAIVDEVLSKDEQIFQKLAAVQKKMAKKHDLTIK
jgi:hypothetical protein